MFKEFLHFFYMVRVICDVSSSTPNNIVSAFSLCRVLTVEKERFAIMACMLRYDMSGEGKKRAASR